MGSWKNHVRSQLLHRDDKEKLPYVGVFNRLTQLEDQFEIRTGILEDLQCKSLERAGVEVDINTKLLQLQLRESEHLAEKLSQTVSDMTSVLYVKEAEVQYWQSRVSQHRQEALTLAKAKNNLKAALQEFEFTMECQSKELMALRSEHTKLKEALEQAHRDKEELVQRWIEEKSAEADRLNEHNDLMQTWQHLDKQLKKHFHGERGKRFTHLLTDVTDGATEASQSVIQGVQDSRQEVEIKTASLLQKMSGIANPDFIVETFINLCLFK
ncbi:autophagy-related protein 16 isoform X1 [Poecilia latipinna]|uniref:autophagy-related protein 16 isoform X1 n=1 Tax=Poecilia latipinna TaxID=48699 RepID=UPI00072E68AC|nr:PREDICTED: autophagy-related protein 16-like isoform X1 [Poecilia latipinna]